eukprot:s1703_g8.t1
MKSSPPVTKRVRRLRLKLNLPPGYPPGAFNVWSSLRELAWFGSIASGTRGPPLGRDGRDADDERRRGKTEEEEEGRRSCNELRLCQILETLTWEAALSNAEDELTALLARWRRFEPGQVAPNELPAILRNRAAVKLRGNRAQDCQPSSMYQDSLKLDFFFGGSTTPKFGLLEALADLDEALELCKKAKSDQLVQYDEMPKVLIARGGALRALRRYSEAVKDYDLAAELFGEPDLEQLSGRAQAKVGLQEPAAAAEDFDAAAELLRAAGRRPEAEIEAERAADLSPAEEAFAGVIRRSVGLLSKDMGLLQRVVLADSDARMAMTAISWHKKQPEIAEAFLGTFGAQKPPRFGWKIPHKALAKIDRLTILADEATGKNLALGFADGDVYNCTRYASDSTWIREVRGTDGRTMSSEITVSRARHSMSSQDDVLATLGTPEESTEDEDDLIAA